jgi:ATP-binding cassette, subfamily B, bacterial
LLLDEATSALDEES